jgi:hypothetical protein
VSSVALDRTSGQSVTITLTAGAGGATVEGLRLRANAVTQSDTVEILAESTSSQDAYGERSFTRFAPWMPENDARDIATEVVNVQSEPNPVSVLRVSNLNGQRRVQQYSREVGDRITVTDSVNSVTTQFTIERVLHDIQDAGQFHNTFFSARRISTAALGSTEVFILNSTSQGILNENKLGY